MKKSRTSKDELLKAIIREMRSHGKMNPIKSHDMCEILQGKGYNIIDVTFRKLIKEIQFNGYLKFIVATERGFYYTTSLSHVRTQISSLKSRERCINKVRVALEKQINQLSK